MTRTLTKGGLLGATALALFASPAFAVGVKADTTVANTFTLEYGTGTQTNTITNDGQNGNDAPTTFKVDRVIDLELVGGDTENVLPGADDAPLLYTLSNTGNDDQTFTLATANDPNSAAGVNPGDPGYDNYDASDIKVYYYLESAETDAGSPDNTCDGELNPGDAGVELYSATNLPVVPNDENLCVIVTGDTANTQTDTDAAIVELTASAVDTDGTPYQPNEIGGTNGINTVQTISIDDGTDGVEVADGNFVVTAANVSAIKAVELIGQNVANCETATATTVATELMVPGACVEYTITVTNDGNSDATISSLVDTLPAELNLVSASITGFTDTPVLRVDGATTTSFVANPLVCDGTSTCEVEVSSAELPFTSPGNVGVLTIRALIRG